MPAAKPVYGVLRTDEANERSEEARTTVALLCLVTALSAATFWFVALPLLDTHESKPQSCAMFVMTNSGVLRCVPETAVGAPTAASAPDAES